MSTFSVRVGASSAAACAGLLPDVDPVTLFRRVVENAPLTDSVGTDAMSIGTLLEPQVLELYYRQTGRTMWLCRNALLVTHPRFPWLSCHPDAVPFNGFGNPNFLEIIRKSAQPGVELKVAGRYADDWSEEAKGVPLKYFAQCQILMCATGIKTWDLACLYCSTDFRVYHFTYDEAFCKKIMTRLCKYVDVVSEIITHPQHEWPWRVNRVMPLTHSDDCADLVKWCAPKSIEPVASVDPESDMDTILDEYARVSEEESILKKKRDALANQTRAIIADREGLRWSGGVITNKSQADGKRVLRVKRDQV